MTHSRVRSLFLRATVAALLVSGVTAVGSTTAGAAPTVIDLGESRSSSFSSQPLPYTTIDFCFGFSVEALGAQDPAVCVLARGDGETGSFDFGPGDQGFNELVALITTAPAPDGWFCRAHRGRVCDPGQLFQDFFGTEDVEIDFIRINIHELVIGTFSSSLRFNVELWLVDPDIDGDGVDDDADLCPGTVLPDTATDGEKKNRYLADGNGVFGDSGFTIADTGGCSGSQIIEAAGLGIGHTKFGISRSALSAWVATVPG